LKRDAEEEDIVEIGEGFSFFARLFRMYCPLALWGTS
jgi:hypothetical protein